MRIANESDLPAIVAIYNASIPARRATADTVEVTVASRMDWFRQHAPERHPLLVHERDGRIEGWVGFQPFRMRPAYARTAEISIYLHPEAQGQGLGRRLLDEALDVARGLPLTTILALVFAHNEPSVRLFRSAGFAEWGRLPDVAEMDGKEYSLLLLGRRIAR